MKIFIKLNFSQIQNLFCTNIVKKNFQITIILNIKAIFTLLTNRTLSYNQKFRKKNIFFYTFLYSY